MPPPLPRCGGWGYPSLILPSRISLPRKGCRVGPHIVLFEVCSAYAPPLRSFTARRDDQAIEWLRRTLALRPEIPIQHALLASTLALTGRQAEASEALKQYLSLKGTTSKTIAQLRPQHRALSDNPNWLAYSDRLMDGLRKAGMPEQ